MSAIFRSRQWRQRKSWLGTDSWLPVKGNELQSLAETNDVKEKLDCVLSSDRWGRHDETELTSGNGGSISLRLMSTINNVREENNPPNFFISSPFWRIANCLHSLCNLRHNMNSVAAWLKRLSQWLQFISPHRKSWSICHESGPGTQSSFSLTSLYCTINSLRLTRGIALII